MSSPFGLKARACKFFLQGKCTKGARCPYSHTTDRSKDDARDGVLVTMLTLLFEKNIQQVFLQGNVLCLDRFAEFPDLGHIQSSVDFNVMKFCDALCGAIKQCNVQPEYISLQFNKIRSLHHFTRALMLSGLHVGLKGLCVTNNEISSLEFVKQFQNLPSLIEIQLSDNPVATRADYHDAVRKGLPNLLGLDGGGVHRPPLNLPWARPPPMDETTVTILQSLEQNYFAVIEEKGVNGIMTLYDPSCIFSLTFDGDPMKDMTISVPSNEPKRAEIVRDFSALRMVIDSRRRNVLDKRSTDRSVRGVVDVTSCLSNAIYSKKMKVSHRLASEANVVVRPATADGVGNQTVCALHGEMFWYHNAATSDVSPLRRNFDRTLVMQWNAEGTAYVITNDSLHLRPSTGGGAAASVLWKHDDEDRIKHLAAKYETDVDVLTALLPFCEEDQTLVNHAAQMKGLTVGQIQSCIAVANNDVERGLRVAKACVAHGVTPDAANQMIDGGVI